MLKIQSNNSQRLTDFFLSRYYGMRQNTDYIPKIPNRYTVIP